MKFIALITSKGLSLPHNFTEWAKKHPSTRVEMTPITPESTGMRRWFEGAVIPLITYYQEALDHRNGQNNALVREWLMQEFNGEFITVAGKSKKVARTSKGKLKELSEKVLDWMADQGYKVELLVPADYQKWADEVHSFGGPETYIDYLVSLKKLP